MTVRAHGASAGLVMLFVLGGCTSTAPRWQCWQECTRETYPECRIEPAKKLAARHATHRVPGGEPPTRVGALTLFDDQARQLPMHCRDERAACIELCRGSENRIPRAKAVLGSTASNPAAERGTAATK